MRKSIILTMAAMLLALVMASEVQAWGAFHAGYTRVTPMGVQHYGTTAAYGPYGAYSGAHVTGYSAYGGAYAAGGFRAGGIYGGGAAGVYRRW